MQDIKNKNTIVVKTHAIGRAGRQAPITSCVFIIRNPIDAFLSELSRKTGKSHTAELNTDMLKSEKWQQIKKSGSNRWFNTYNSGLKVCQNKAFIIWYEHIKESPENLISTMKNCHKFLLKHNPEHKKFRFREECLRANMEGSYHRKHKEPLKLEKYFTKSEKVELNEKIKLMNETLIRNLGIGNKVPDFYLL